jgi:CRISPR type I-E-associated protein CasB/Cse2
VRQSRKTPFLGDVDQRLAVLAMTLANVDQSSSIPLAEQLGKTTDGRTPTSDERPRLSANRFGTIVRSARARDWDAFTRAIRRAIAIANSPSFNVRALAKDMLLFNDRVLQRWTFHYWQSSAPNEAAETNSPLETATEVT